MHQKISTISANQPTLERISLRDESKSKVLRMVKPSGLMTGRSGEHVCHKRQCFIAIANGKRWGGGGCSKD